LTTSTSVAGDSNCPLSGGVVSVIIIGSTGVGGRYVQSHVGRSISCGMPLRRDFERVSPDSLEIRDMGSWVLNDLDDDE
jgi:hypothetical protein